MINFHRIHSLHPLLLINFKVFGFIAHLVTSISDKNTHMQQKQR